eukprot:gene19976-25320_t
MGRITPTGFLPEDDPGAFFVVAQLPDGASVGRTSALAAEVEGILKTEPAIADYSTVIGLNFIDNYSQPNAGFFVVTLKPFDQRTGREDSASAVIARLAQKFRAVRAGNVVPIAPPPIIGLGSGGGFSYVLMDMGSADPKALGQALRGLTVAANQEPQLRRVFSTFSDSAPSIYLDIDRDK